MFKLLKPTTVAVALFVLLIFLFSRCIIGNTFESVDARGTEYAGSKACLQCHKDISSSYSHTSHFRTSRLINELPPGWLSQDAFAFNDSVNVRVVKTDSGIVQAEYINGKLALAKPLQLAIGSGDQAESFGYRSNGRVQQLPLTYFAGVHEWANSPGFPSAEPYFYRPVLIRCFECHASFAKDVANQTGGMGTIGIDSASIIYGIDCERCHGAAANHVRFHLENPSEKQAKYIAKWQSLSRQQRLDACAVCHSGNDRALQASTFGFEPGDTLTKYYFPFDNGSTESDVHGKQMQLLESSRCFQMTKTLECSSCHTPHQPLSRNAVDMSGSCKNCHSSDGHVNCPIASKLRSSLQNNCIDCHMPKLVSKKINIQGEAQQTRDYLLRTHRIAIYPEESNKILLLEKD